MKTHRARRTPDPKKYPSANPRVAGWWITYSTSTAEYEARSYENGIPAKTFFQLANCTAWARANDVNGYRLPADRIEVSDA